MDLSSSIWCFHPDYRLARVKKSVKEPVDYQGMIKKKNPPITGDTSLHR